MAKPASPGTEYVAPLQQTAPPNASSADAASTATPLLPSTSFDSVDATSHMAATTFSWSGYFTAIGTLLILLALLWGLVWALRKSGRFNFIPRPGMFPRDGLRIEAQLPLGPRKGLTVVRFLNKRLLLGVTEQNITLLQEIEDKDDSTDFQSLLETEHQKTPSA